MFFCSEKKEAEASRAVLQKSLKKLNLMIDEMIDGKRELIPVDIDTINNEAKNKARHR